MSLRPTPPVSELAYPNCYGIPGKKLLYSESHHRGGDKKVGLTMSRRFETGSKLEGWDRFRQMDSNGKCGFCSSLIGNEAAESGM
jgi:hypothetical protein